MEHLANQSLINKIFDSSKDVKFDLQNVIFMGHSFGGMTQLLYTL